MEIAERKLLLCVFTDVIYFVWDTRKIASSADAIEGIIGA